MYADRDRCCRHAQRLDSHATAGETAQAVRRVRQVGGKQLGRLRLKGNSASSASHVIFLFVLSFYFILIFLLKNNKKI